MISQQPGTLYLVPVLLGDSGVSDVLPDHTLKVTAGLKFFIAENTKSARQFLKQVPGISPQQELSVLEIDKHSEHIDFNYYFGQLRKGSDTGLISEAGMPAVADPGSLFVRRAHQEGIRIVPLTGPSSLLLALAASGLNGQGFTFHGYLPKEKMQRIEKIKLLEQQAKRNHQTQIFIETPYRNQALFNDLLQSCNPGTTLCIAMDLTLKEEMIKTMTIGEWKKTTLQFQRQQAVFLLL